MKTEKAAGPSDISLELVAASREVGIKVMAELCQRDHDGLGMPTEWAISIVDSIFKGKGDIRNCSCYRTMKLLDHGMMV